jgi:hypothetical protein
MTRMGPVLAQIGDGLEVSGASSPPMTFVNRQTGAEVRWSFIDQKTGERGSPSDIEINSGPGADDLIRWRLTHGKQELKGEGSLGRSRNTYWRLCVVARHQRLPPPSLPCCLCR